MKSIVGIVLGTMAGLASAQSSVTVYGVVDAAVTSLRVNAGTVLPGSGAAVAGQHMVRLDSGIGPPSRLGFTGAEDLGDGLNAIFTLEMGFNADSGALGQGGLGFGRQAFVGLTSGRGWTARFGRQYTPMLETFAASDALLGAYWGNAANASGHGTYASIGAVAGSGGSYGSTGRANNSGYFSYKAGPFTAKLLVGLGDESTNDAGRVANAALAYSSEQLALQASVLQMRQAAAGLVAGAGPERLKEWVVGGSYDLRVAKVFGGYYKFSGPRNLANLSPVATVGNAAASPFAFNWTDTKTAWVGTRIPLGLATVIPQVFVTRYAYPTGPEGRSTGLALTGEYLLSKRTAVYSSYAQIRNDAVARTPMIATIAVVTTSFGSDPKVLSVGMRHAF